MRYRGERGNRSTSGEVIIVVPDRDKRRFVHMSVDRAGAPGRVLLAREKEMPMSSPVRPLALSDQDVAELKSRHLACSLLVKGCQTAIFDFRERAARGTATDQQALAAHRTVEILEDILESWCNTLSVLRSALNQTSAQRMAAGQWLEVNPGVHERTSRPRMGHIDTTRT